MGGGPVDAVADRKVEHAALIAHGGGQHRLHGLNFLPHSLNNHPLGLNASQILSILGIRIPGLKG